MNNEETTLQSEEQSYSIPELNQDTLTHELWNATERGINWAVTNPDSLSPGHQHFKEVELTDGASVSMNVADGDVFFLSATGDRTILTPSNPTYHRKIIIKHYASGANRTLTLTTGSAGAFRFGTTITALSATASGKTDYIGCIYNATDDRFDVVSVVKGF